MKTENKKIKAAALASGAAILGAFGTSATAAELLNFEDLGTGSELRSQLITADAMSAFTSNTDVEFECGEGKCGEGKCGEGKCGEGKCGEKSDKKAEKAENKTEMKAAEKTENTNQNNEMMMNSQQSKSKSDNQQKKADPKN